jgi:hypothetical protein
MQSRIVRAASCMLGLVMAVHALGGIALATPVAQVPEIDGGSVAAGLGLLVSGILLLRSRRSR